MGGDVLEANDTFLELVGYEREDLLAGRVNWLAMTPAEHRGSTGTIVTQARETGASVRYEKEYVRRDGTACPFSWPLPPSISIVTSPW